ncbi:MULTISPECIES: pleiotropic regulatory protein RsmS [Vibrio]|uniref:DUF2496 domain-containing protein n=1 Tax=Vibrio casei TaxID=673372 RepID=A0A368LM95_9VIBR|nr:MULTISPECIES: pleiotropic regulatory protein RsmS [Vibrio]RCS73002.1 DUF2496 domain-containing protein [Vibrio casei]SJN32946.1 hypothetical protein FM109_11520 [Vibrio casei]HBV75391.1 DUF2496 domain-containing protein [Vibrio sp.]
MTTANNTSDSNLDSAPAEVQLAVDLIYLLENNDIDPQIALKALIIVQQDLNRKITDRELP